MQYLEVINDTHRNALDKINKHAQNGGESVIALTAPWCGHCNALKPELAKMKSKLRGGTGIVANVSDKYHSQLKMDTKVDGFPTIRHFKGGNKVKDYEGKRKALDLANFANNSLNATMIGGRRKKRRKTKRRKRKRRKIKRRKTKRRKVKHRKTKRKHGGRTIKQVQCGDDYEECIYSAEQMAKKQAKKIDKLEETFKKRPSGTGKTTSTEAAYMEWLDNERDRIEFVRSQMSGHCYNARKKCLAIASQTANKNEEYNNGANNY